MLRRSSYQGLTRLLTSIKKRKANSQNHESPNPWGGGGEGVHAAESVGGQAPLMLGACIIQHVAD